MTLFPSLNVSGLKKICFYFQLSFDFPTRDGDMTAARLRIPRNAYRPCEFAWTIIFILTRYRKLSGTTVYQTLLL